MANKVYVGVDIAQAKFDAAIWQGSTGTTLNTFSNEQRRLRAVDAAAAGRTAPWRSADRLGARADRWL